MSILSADDLVDEALLLLAECNFYDARSLRAFAALPLLQREIVTESLFRALPPDKQQTVAWRLGRFETRWGEIAEAAE